MKQHLILGFYALTQASNEILKYYRQNFEIYTKADQTPITSADKASHDIICKYLKSSKIPVLSEEGGHYSYEVRKKWKTYWLLDPIDGTKEFINKTDQFCISLALIKERKPIIGFLFAPALNLFYFASKDLGSYKFEENLETLSKILDSNFTYKNYLKKIIEKSKKLPFEEPCNYTSIISPYKSKKIQNYLENLKNFYPNLKIKKMASALKMAILAQGGANEYIRFNPIFEWDLAAGHAILLYAGFLIKYFQGGDEEILYNNVDIKIKSLSAYLYIKK